MEENGKKNAEQRMIEQQITVLETTKDSFRQNASFAEKNLLIKGMFFPYNDDHDIKNLKRTGIENMLNAVNFIKQKNAPSDIKNIGRKGINQWIWENRIAQEIPLDVLKNYLHKKKNNDAFSFYNQYKLVCELVQEISAFHHIPSSELRNELTLSKELMQHLFKSFATTQAKRGLVTELYKHVQGNSVTYLPIYASVKRQKKTNHPKIIDYQKQLEKEGKAIGTQIKVLNHMNMLFPWLVNNMRDFESYEVHSIPILKVKEMHLQEFRAYLFKKLNKGEYSRITAAECIYTVKNFFRFMKKKYGFPDPSKKLKSFRAPRYRQRELPTDEQITEFFNVIDRYSDNPILERIAFRLMLSLGLRSIEVSRIAWNDINMGIKTINIHGKGDRSDTLPLVGQLYEDFQMIEQNPPSSAYLFGDSVKQNLKTLHNNYKLYSLIAGWEFSGGAHLFRHAFVTKLAENNILPQALQKLSRVERLDTVSLYTHLSQKQLRLNQEINKLKYT